MVIRPGKIQVAAYLRAYYTIFSSRHIDMASLSFMFGIVPEISASIADNYLAKKLGLLSGDTSEGNSPHLLTHLMSEAEERIKTRHELKAQEAQLNESLAILQKLTQDL